MKLNLKAKIGQLNRLKGKKTFTVADMIKLLNNLDETAEIRFGVLTEKATEFYQDDNFIFRLAQDSREDEWEGNYVVEIITDGKGIY